MICGMAARQINLAARTGSSAALNRVSGGKSIGSIRLYYGVDGWSVGGVVFEMQRGTSGKEMKRVVFSIMSHKSLNAGG